MSWLNNKVRQYFIQVYEGKRQTAKNYFRWLVELLVVVVVLIAITVRTDSSTATMIEGLLCLVAFPLLAIWIVAVLGEDTRERRQKANRTTMRVVGCQPDDPRLLK